MSTGTEAARPAGVVRGPLADVAPAWLRSRGLARARQALAWGGCRLARARARLRGANYETDAVAWYLDMWRRAAGEAGADFQDLGYGFCRIVRDGAAVRAYRQWLSVDDAVTLRLAGNKPIVLGWLRERGLPVAPYLAFPCDDLEPAWRFLREQGTACVVKPAEGTGGGAGVTAGIRTARGLAWAAAQAGAFGSRLLIERLVPGENYRLLYLDGELVGAIRRESPSVRGDGRSTIRALIERENERRDTTERKVLRPIVIDRRCRDTLASAGLSLRSVPPDGVAVAVKRASNQAGDHDTEDVTAGVGEALVREGAAAAAAVGVRLAGVDVITTDPRRSLQETGGVVLEVNTTPGLHLHVLVRNPPPRAAGVILLDRLLAAAPRG